MKIKNRYFLLFLLIFSACEDRDRLNPLDPENEMTHGAPFGIKILSHRNKAIITWKPFRVNDLIAYEIYRGTEDSLMVLVSIISADTLEFQDSGLEYFQPYYYGVKALTTFSQSQISEPVRTILGPNNLWVADMYSFLLRNISFDGTQIQKLKEYTSPRSLAWDSKLDLLWLGDYHPNKVFGLDRNFNIIKEIQLPDSPVDIAIDSINQHLFAILRDTTLRAYDENGALLWTYKLNNVPNFSTEILYDHINHSLWISMNPSDRVLKLVMNGNSLEVEEFLMILNPGPLAIDPIEGGVWVSTEAGIIRIRDNGNIKWYKQDLFIYDISIHPQTGDCYYTGRKEQGTVWETGFLPRDNPDNSIVILGEEVGRLYNIQVVPGNDPPGIFVQQAFTWKLLRYTGKGEKIGELENFNSKLEFILDY